MEGYFEVVHPVQATCWELIVGQEQYVGNLNYSDINSKMQKKKISLDSVPSSSPELDLHSLTM